MLDELRIEQLGVIEDVSLSLAAGLTVVTGETGAGKTMIVTALQLLLGARADTTVIRAGADAARVEARVRPAPPEAAEWTDGENEELVVHREILAEGRSRVRLNGRLATVGALRDALGGAVEVHAQHEHVQLERADVQRTLLDRYAGAPHGRVLERYREAYRAWREAAHAWGRLEDDARERARERDRLAFEVEEITRAQIDPAVDEHLDERLEVLEHAEELQLAAAQVGEALGADAAGEPLGRAVAILRRLDVEDPELTRLRERVEGLVAEAKELAADVRAYGDGIEVDPARLEELRERQQLLATLRRKYGHDVAAVIAYGQDARARLDALDTAESDAEALEARVQELRAELAELSGDLRRGRELAADGLVEAVDGHLRELGMPHAAFQVAVESLEQEADPGPDGADRITFLLAPNPGEPARPLAKASSGGERSRVALAVEAALADVHDAAVLVFDEIDAGIGGATAMAVGEKLARLATGRQVLCVTHLAQLAAFADRHHVVEKGLRAGRTVTTTRQVAEDQRVAELSRMLSGDPDRDAAQDHARALLDEAGARRAG